MINFDNYANENKTENKSKWSNVPDHPYRILIVGGSDWNNKCITASNKQPARYWWKYICTLKIQMELISIFH